MSDDLCDQAGHAQSKSPAESLNSSRINILGSEVDYANHTKSRKKSEENVK